ncbi:MAG: phosphodiesterase [Succinivibrio sp.]
MKYLVLSDIHGGAIELEKALGYFDRFECDLLILLGDLLNHGPRNNVPSSYDPMRVAALLNGYGERIISVRGNCDSEVDSMVMKFPCNAPYAFIHIKKADKTVKIMLTHGHLYRYDTAEAAADLSLKSGDIVLSGHTHVNGIFRKSSGVVNINAGSITLPKENTQASFALIDEQSVKIISLASGDIIDQYCF